MGKAVKKIAKKVIKISDAIGLLPKGTSEGVLDQWIGTDLSGNKAQAARDAADATARNEALLAQLSQQQAASNVDLGFQNTPDTIVGGTAESLAAGNNPRKKRGAAGGVASSLGINV